MSQKRHNPATSRHFLYLFSSFHQLHMPRASRDHQATENRQRTIKIPWPYLETQSGAEDESTPRADCTVQPTLFNQLHRAANTLQPTVPRSQHSSANYILQPTRFSQLHPAANTLQPTAPCSQHSPANCTLQLILSSQLHPADNCTLQSTHSSRLLHPAANTLLPTTPCSQHSR